MTTSTRTPPPLLRCESGLAYNPMQRCRNWKVTDEGGRRLPWCDEHRLRHTPVGFTLRDDFAAKTSAIKEDEVLTLPGTDELLVEEVDDYVATLDDILTEGDPVLQEMVVGTIRRIWLDYGRLAAENQRLRDVLSLFLDMPATFLVDRIEHESADQYLELVAQTLGRSCRIDQSRHLVVDVGPDETPGDSSFVASLRFFLGGSDIDIETDYSVGERHFATEAFAVGLGASIRDFLGAVSDQASSDHLMELLAVDADPVSAQLLERFRQDMARRRQRQLETVEAISDASLANVVRLRP